jgi:hypothetical protein
MFSGAWKMLKDTVLAFINDEALVARFNQFERTYASESATDDWNPAKPRQPEQCK